MGGFNGFRGDTFIGVSGARVLSFIGVRSSTFFGRDFLLGEPDAVDLGSSTLIFMSSLSSSLSSSSSSSVTSRDMAEVVDLFFLGVDVFFGGDPSLTDINDVSSFLVDDKVVGLEETDVIVELGETVGFLLFRLLFACIALIILCVPVTPLSTILVTIRLAGSFIGSPSIIRRSWLMLTLGRRVKTCNTKLACGFLPGLIFFRTCSRSLLYRANSGFIFSLNFLFVSSSRFFFLASFFKRLS